MTLKKIDRYEILKKLSEGRLGTIYHVVVPYHLPTTAALRLLPPELAQNDSHFIPRFMINARVLINLHPPADINLVTVFDAGVYEDRPYLVMRYMPGGSLADRIKRGPLKLGETAWILNRIADALDWVHSKQIHHEGVKPTNILFDKRGGAFLADVALEKLTRLPDIIVEIMDKPMEEPMHIVTYMAPEMATQSGGSPQSDVYQLGITLFEALTGRPPYRAKKYIEVLLAHLREPIPDICALRPDLPPELQAIIERALAKEPAARYQKAADLAADFVRVVGPHIPLGERDEPG